MRLFELTQSYFHGSKSPMKFGSVLKGRMIRHEDDESKMVEQFLEKYRPENKTDRNESVFMVGVANEDVIEKAGGYANYIYEFFPVGEVEKNDSTWWAEIYLIVNHYLDATAADKIQIEKEIASLALNYWNGKASPSPQFEYRAKMVKVGKCVGGYNETI